MIELFYWIINRWNKFILSYKYKFSFRVSINKLELNTYILCCNDPWHFKSLKILLQQIKKIHFFLQLPWRNKTYLAISSIIWSDVSGVVFRGEDSFAPSQCRVVDSPLSPCVQCKYPSLPAAAGLLYLYCIVWCYGPGSQGAWWNGAALHWIVKYNNLISE